MVTLNSNSKESCYFKNAEKEDNKLMGEVQYY